MNDEDKNKEVSELLAKELESTHDVSDVSDVTYVDSTEDGEALSSKDVTKKLREDLKLCRAEKEEYLTGWQRAKADYINLQKEHGDHQTKSSVVTKEKFARNLLPALDSFDMAFANKEAWEKVDKNWRMGVEYIYSQFINGFAESGIEKIDEVGVKFDPILHESIESIVTDKEEKDHSIEKIIQVGYRLGDRIIRPARVNIFEYKK